MVSAGKHSRNRHCRTTATLAARRCLADGKERARERSQRHRNERFSRSKDAALARTLHRQAAEVTIFAWLALCLICGAVINLHVLHHLNASVVMGTQSEVVEAAPVRQHYMYIVESAHLLKTLPDSCARFGPGWESHGGECIRASCSSSSAHPPIAKLADLGDFAARATGSGHKPNRATSDITMTRRSTAMPSKLLHAKKLFANLKDDADEPIENLTSIQSRHAVIFGARYWHTGVSNHGCTRGNLTSSSRKDSEGGRSTLMFMASSPSAPEVGHGRYSHSDTILYIPLVNLHTKYKR
jgi:hypothetical protein